MAIENDELRKFFEDLINTNKEVRDLMKTAEDSSKKAEEEAKKIRQAQQEMVSKINQTVGSLGRSLSQGSGSFSGLTTAVDMAAGALTKLFDKLPSIYGAALKGITEAVAGIVKFSIQSFDKFYSEYEKISQVGIVTTTTDLKNSMAALKTNISDTGKILSQNSKQMAFFGGSAVKGREILEGVAFEGTEARNQLQRVGISASEYADIQIGYLDRLARSGGMAGKSMAQLSKESFDYAVEIDKLSKLTGLNRQEIQKELDTRMSDARYRASIVDMHPKIKDNIDGFLSQLNAAAPGIKQGVQELIASRGVPTTEAARVALMALQQGGINVQEFIKGLRSGTIQQSKAFDMIAKAAARSASAQTHLAKFYGSEIEYTKQIVELKNLERLSGLSREDREKEIAKLQKGAMEGRDKENKQLADTKVALYNTQTNLELLALEIPFVTKSLNVFSETMEALTDKILELTGDDSLPEHLRLRKEENKLLRQERELKNKIADEMKNLPGYAPGEDSGMKSLTARSRMGRLRSYENELGEVSAKRQSITTQRQIAQEIIYGPNSSSDMRVATSLDPKLQEIKSIIENQMSGRVTSSIRPYGKNMNSKHPKGLALDFQLSPDIYSKENNPETWAKNVDNIRSKMKSLGVSYFKDEYNEKSPDWTGPHFHIEVPPTQRYGTGGTVNEPTVALIGERGPEGVVPLPDGRSIPVKFGDEFGKRLDALISLTERQNSMLGNVFDRLT